MEQPLFVVALIALVALGVLARIWMMSSPMGAPDGDEAVSGLMARHILRGEFPVFFWGQHYGGAAEAYLTAMLFGLFGSSVVTLKLIPVFLYALGAVVLWRVALRLGYPRAVLAAAVFWVAPAYFVWKSTKAHAVYGLLLVLGLMTILLVLRLSDDPSSIGDRLWLGLTLGLGWWVTPQIVLIAAPALVWLTITTPRFLRWSWLLVPGALLGAAPWLGWNVANDWASLKIGLPLPDNTYASHFPVFFRRSLPTALGLRVPFSQSWLPAPVPGLMAYVTAALAFLWVAFRWRRNTRLFVLIGFAYPFIFSLSPWAWYTEEPRYLVPLAPIIVLLLVCLVNDRAIRVAAIAVLVVSSIVGLARMDAERLYPELAPDVPVPHDFSELIRTLHEHDVDRVLADYWVAYRLSFESDESIIATSTGLVRYQPHDVLVRRDPQAATVFVKGSASEAGFVDSIRSEDTSYSRYETEDFVIYEPRLGAAAVDPVSWTPPPVQAGQ